MADELSIDETNKLRASLGLPPLKARKSPSEAPSAETAPPPPVAQGEQEASETSSDDEEDDGLDLSDQVAARDGAILVIEDSEILKGKKKEVSRKRPRLVGLEQDANAEDEDEQGNKKGRLDKKHFLANVARSDGPIKKEEDEIEKPNIVGARLYEGDIAMDIENDSRKSKKKKSKRAEAITQTKIIRRNVVRSAVSLGAEDDDAEEESVATTNLAPRSFGKIETVEEDDDVKALEASLLRARKANTTATTQTQTKRSIDHQAAEEEDQYETFVSTSDFAFVEPVQNVPKLKEEQIEPDRIILNEGETQPQTSGSGVPQSGNSSAESQGSEQVKIQAIDTSTVASQQPSSQPKVHRRALASTLMALKAEGDGKRDEIIIGRANDAKPLLDLNKPGDMVILEYRDDHGHLLTQKEKYRQLMYQFRGEGPGPKKLKKREMQIQRELAERSGGSSSSNAAGVGELTKAIKKDHVVLWKH